MLAGKRQVVSEVIKFVGRSGIAKWFATCFESENFDIQNWWSLNISNTTGNKVKFCRHLATRKTPVELRDHSLHPAAFGCPTKGFYCREE